MSYKKAKQRMNQDWKEIFNAVDPLIKVMAEQLTKTAKQTLSENKTTVFAKNVAALTELLSFRSNCFGYLLSQYHYLEPEEERQQEEE